MPAGDLDYQLNYQASLAKFEAEVQRMLAQQQERPAVSSWRFRTVAPDVLELLTPRERDDLAAFFMGEPSTNEVLAMAQRLDELVRDRRMRPVPDEGWRWAGKPKHWGDVVEVDGLPELVRRGQAAQPLGAGLLLEVVRLAAPALKTHVADLLAKMSGHYLSLLAAGYRALTGIPADRAALVVEYREPSAGSPSGQLVFYFEERQP